MDVFTGGGGSGVGGGGMGGGEGGRERVVRGKIYFGNPQSLSSCITNTTS